MIYYDILFVLFLCLHENFTEKSAEILPSLPRVLAANIKIEYGNS